MVFSSKVRDKMRSLGVKDPDIIDSSGEEGLSLLMSGQVGSREVLFLLETTEDIRYFQLKGKIKYTVGTPQMIGSFDLHSMTPEFDIKKEMGL